MRLGLKELDALRWIAEQSDLNSLDVSSYRDQADVGWLRVACIFPQRGRSSHLGLRTFKVSPLGHVYDASGKVVREGPALGPDGQKRPTTRV